MAKTRSRLEAMRREISKLRREKARMGEAADPDSNLLDADEGRVQFLDAVNREISIGRHMKDRAEGEGFSLPKPTENISIAMDVVKRWQPDADDPVMDLVANCCLFRILDLP